MINLKPIDAPSFQHVKSRTQILAKAGFEPPAEHGEIADRLRAFVDHMDRPITTRLIAAIVSGEGDVEALRAQALAEVDCDRRRLNELVTNGVTAAQARLVVEVGTDTYGQVQAAFNEAATAFAKAASVIDPETSAEEVIALGNLKTQQAWQDAATYAAQLDHLLVPLVSAAANAGVIHPASGESASTSRAPHTRSLVLGLVVDVSAVENIRDAWNALDAEGRTGVWGQLLKIGAKIGAKSLEDYEPLRRPAPLVDKKIDRGDGTFGWVTVDPELEPEDPAVN